jgi:thymidylate synthase ThyX
MTTILARGILSSYNADTDDTIHTLLLTYPRWLHAEFMTHRAFSRNASSSRAIPVRRLIEEALQNPAKPLYWLKEKPGMQGGEPLHEEDQAAAERHWDEARTNAIRAATYLSSLGVHKQTVNRLLEPYTHITVLVTSTEWDNFFKLRDHPDAEPHLRLLAAACKKARREAKFQSLVAGQWHTPFVGHILPEAPELRRAVACCASTSYRTVEGDEMTQERADSICAKLTKSVPFHASPFEHIACADRMYNGGYLRPTSHRNFRGWIQLRALIEQEELSI